MKGVRLGAGLDISDAVKSKAGHTLDDFQILTILKQRETTDMKTVLTDFEPYNSSVSNGSS